MLTEERTEVVTERVDAPFVPADDQFPHYRLTPLHADRQGYYCLIFFVKADSFIVLESHIKRYTAVRKLALLMENAEYPVFEIRRA